MEKSYVIMLNEDFDGNSDQYVIRTEDETLAQARLRQEYDGILYTMPRDVCNAKSIEPKTLNNTKTGEAHDGAIYEFRSP